jgi:hypothetical protein
MTKLHKTAEGYWTRCIATVRKGAGVTDCPLELEGVKVTHTIGFQGVAENGGGVVRTPLNEGRYRWTTIVDLKNGTFRAATPSLARIYSSTSGKLLNRADRDREQRERKAAYGAVMNEELAMRVSELRASIKRTPLPILSEGTESYTALNLDGRHVSINPAKFHVAKGGRALFLFQFADPKSKRPRYEARVNITEGQDPAEAWSEFITERFQGRDENGNYVFALPPLSGTKMTKAILTPDEFARITASFELCIEPLTDYRNVQDVLASGDMSFNDLGEVRLAEAS